MKTFKIIAITAILSGGLLMGTYAQGALVTASTAGGTPTKSAQPATPALSPMDQVYANEQKALTDQKTASQTPSTITLNDQVTALQAQVASLQARIAVLEARQGIVSNNTTAPATAPSCPSISEQIARGYVYNMCTGKKL